MSDERRLEPVVDTALAFAFGPDVSPIPITFSTRQFEEVANNIVAAPEDLATVPSVDATILCAEGRLQDRDRWAIVHKHAGRIQVWSGLDFVFQPQTLKQQIKDWFVGQRWASFGP